MTNVLAVGPRSVARYLAASLSHIDSVKVTGCSSRRALARQVRGRQFDLAVADWRTARREGMAMLSQTGIPVLLISDPERLAQAYRLGKAAEILLETPVNPRELTALVTALVNREATPQRIPGSEKKAATTAAGAGT